MLFLEVIFSESVLGGLANPVHHNEVTADCEKNTVGRASFLADDQLSKITLEIVGLFGASVGVRIRFELNYETVDLATPSIFGASSNFAA